MIPNGEKRGVRRFGAFEVDLTSRELRKGGALVKLQSQQFELLTLLTERAGQVVTREEIRRALWDEETFVDFDQSINFCVNKVRDALGDDPQSPRYIETVPRKGYRFIGFAEAAAAHAVVSKPIAARRWWLLSAGALAALAAIAVAATTSLSWRHGAKPIESLAVLPLENLSHDPEQEYFADGMTDELITDLAKISALRVISRTSVMQYKGTKKPVPQIARELNVDAVLEGTVTRDQGRVRITAQLIGAAPEKHLWAEKYEAGLSEVLTVQDAVATAVVRAIQIKVTAREHALLAAPRAVDSDAHDAYLKARYWWSHSAEGGPEHSSEERLRKSLGYFEQAIAKDPAYALAWAGLADTYNTMAAFAVLPRADAAPRARQAAEKALELDNSLVGPITALGSVKMAYEWDWAGAEREYKRAIKLDSNYGVAHQHYSVLLAMVGRTEEAVAEARRAHEVNPLAYGYTVNLAWYLYIAHRFDQAEVESRKLIEWQPAFPKGYACLGAVYLQKGRQREAVAELRKATELHSEVQDLAWLGNALGVSGIRPEAEKVLREMLDLSRKKYVPPEYIAIVYEGLGEREQALRWFEKAVAERSMNGWVLPDPRLDSIRTEPRFKNLMRRMGLPL